MAVLGAVSPDFSPRQVFDALSIVSDVCVGVTEDHGHGFPAAKGLERGEITVGLIVPYEAQVLPAIVDPEVGDACTATGAHPKAV